MFACSSMGILAREMQFLECLLFGALISATDPVTVLAIFNQLRVVPNMYMLVFGESVLNDAVAIVLYRTVLAFFSSPVTSRSVLAAVLTFCIIFVGSLIIGTGVGLASAILFKHNPMGSSSDGGDHHVVASEVGMLVLFPYAAYMLSEGLGLSGIVSILFCGIVMAYYTTQNLSRRTKEASFDFFRVLASLSETFVFVYMGISFFTLDVTLTTFISYVKFFVLSLIACLVARAANVFPAARIANSLGLAPRTRSGRRGKIPRSYQVMLWFSGLRGAIAFALALDAKEKLGGEAGNVILTSTLLIVLSTVVIIGGCTTTMLQKLRIPINVADGDELGSNDDDDDDDGGADDDGRSRLDYENRLKMRGKWKRRENAGTMGLDVEEREASAIVGAHEDLERMGSGGLGFGRGKDNSTADTSNGYDEYDDGMETVRLSVPASSSQHGGGGVEMEMVPISIEKAQPASPRSMQDKWRQLRETVAAKSGFDAIDRDYLSPFFTNTPRANIMQRRNSGKYIELDEDIADHDDIDVEDDQKDVDSTQDDTIHKDANNGTQE